MMPLVSGRPGPGESSTASGCERDGFVDGERIVAYHDRVGAELAEILHEVVHEAVVAVDHEHPGHAAQYGRRHLVRFSGFLLVGRGGPCTATFRFESNRCAVLA